ncbi:unnamed protein product [Cylicostephanus goldi]|uniref:Uncharacterized protein n=1 Tax=Cylicostephanus goldi TaxID=71465 RepID=A0A3P6QMN6_CYLGO|nr:unnamed protein product [Cylicostephanus goldi]
MALILQTYDEPTTAYSETTAITRTSYTISPKKLDRDIEKRPEAVPRKGSPVEEKKGAKDDLSFLRTQSEFINRGGEAPSSLPRTEERTQIFEPITDTTEKLSR